MENDTTAPSPAPTPAPAPAPRITFAEPGEVIHVEPMPFAHWPAWLKTQTAATFLADVRSEVERQRDAEPRNRDRLCALVERVGYLAGALRESRRFGGPNVDSAVQAQQIYGEAVTVAALALRVAIEGDAGFPYLSPVVERQRAKR